MKNNRSQWKVPTMKTNVFVCVSQVVVTSSYGDYSSYMHAVSQYYSQTQMSQTAAQVYQHRDVSKVLYTHTHTDTHHA